MKTCPHCQRSYADNVKFCPRDGSTLAATDDRTDPIIGRVIGGRYEVLEHLGGGGFGNVYKVKNLRLDDIEALKVIHPELLLEQEPLERFRREAKLLRQLGRKSVHIVDLYNLEQDTDDRFYYFTMEYVKGASLTQALMKGQPIAVERALALIRQICAALEVAHADGVIHRDLKLDNILLTRENGGELVKILDFGIAKVLSQQSLTDLSRGMPGTVGYAAPEQIKGQPELIGPPTDLFAIGVVLYNLTTARKPWNGQLVGESLPSGGEWEIIKKTLEAAPLPQRKFNRQIPKKVEAITLKLLEKNPRQRFQSARELNAALASLQSLPAAVDASPSPQPVRPPAARDKPVRRSGRQAVQGERGSRKRFVTATLFLLVLALTGTLIYRNLLPLINLSSREASEIEIRALRDAVTVGATLQLDAIVFAADGDRLDLPVTWSVSDPSVAGVSEAGLLSASSPGTVTVTAEAGGIWTTRDITVAPQPLVRIEAERIEFQPAELNLTEGESMTIRATVWGGDGNILTDRLVIFASDDDGIASVDGLGTVMAHADGSATISALVDDSVRALLAVVVSKAIVPVARVEIEPSEVSLFQGDSRRLSARALDPDDNPLDRALSWRSRDPTIAQVANGTVRGTGPGATTVSATTGGVSGTARITVREAKITSLRIDPPSLTMLESETGQLKALLRDERGMNVDRPIDWWSEKEQIARVTSEGLVTGVSPGSTRVTAKSGDASGEALVSVEARRAIAWSGTPRSWFSDGQVMLGLSLHISGYSSARLCAVARFTHSNGPPLVDNDGAYAFGGQVAVLQDINPKVNSGRINLELSLPAGELELNTKKYLGRNELQAHAQVMAGSCNETQPNSKPLLTPKAIPVCVEKLAVGYRAC